MANENQCSAESQNVKCHVLFPNFVITLNSFCFTCFNFLDNLYKGTRVLKGDNLDCLNLK